MHHTPLLASTLESTLTAAAELDVASTAKLLLSSRSMATAKDAAAAESSSICVKHRQERPQERPSAAVTEFCTGETQKMVLRFYRFY